jgi:hypothetical protein
MKYLERIWRGMMLAIDLYFMHLNLTEILKPGLRWYLLIFCWLMAGFWTAFAMYDFKMLKKAFKKHKSRRGAGAY